MKSNKLFVAVAITLFAGSAMAAGLSPTSLEYINAQRSVESPVQTHVLTVQPTRGVGALVNVSSAIAKPKQSANTNAESLTYPG